MTIDKFVRCLEYDKAYAANMYNTNEYWTFAITKLRENDTVNFIYCPMFCTPICEFVEFIIGNGFDVIKTEKINHDVIKTEKINHYDIRVTIRRKKVV